VNPEFKQNQQKDVPIEKMSESDFHVQFVHFFAGYSVRQWEIKKNASA